MYHDTTWHIFIAAGYRNAGVVILRTGNRLDAICYDLSALEGITHT